VISDYALESAATKELMAGVQGMRIALALLIFLGSLSVSASKFDDTKVRAEQSDAEAQYLLGDMYAKGEGTPQDTKEAVRWYRASAEQGHAKAQFNLAFMYQYGLGAPQDYKSAHMWWNLQAANGDEDAKGNRDTVAREMTSADISEAQQMASDWIKAHP
jgi:uncharacterized protein